MRQPSQARLVLTHVGLVLFTALTLYPVLWVFRLAFEPDAGLSGGLIPIPTEVSFENFAKVLGTTDQAGSWLFGRQLFNSLFVSILTSGLGLVFSATAAYALSRWDFPGRERAIGAFLVTQMFPGVVMLIPIYILLDELGLLDSLLGLALVYSTTSVPFSVWMLKGYFDTIPRALEEAAALDGCTRFQTFWSVILPLAKPALAVVALFSFMTAWNEFILAATLMGDARSYTLPVVLNGYVNEYGADWGAFAAGAIVVSLPVMILFFMLQRYFVEGLTAGSVKG